MRFGGAGKDNRAIQQQSGRAPRPTMILHHTPRAFLLGKSAPIAVLPGLPSKDVDAGLRVDAALHRRDGAY